MLITRCDNGTEIPVARFCGFQLTFQEGCRFIKCLVIRFLIVFNAFCWNDISPNSIGKTLQSFKVIVNVILIAKYHSPEGCLIADKVSGDISYFYFTKAILSKYKFAVIW